LIDEGQPDYLCLATLHILNSSIFIGNEQSFYFSP